MRAAASTLIALAVVAVVAYVALRGQDYAPVHYVSHTSPATAAVSGRAVDRAGNPVADVALTWYSAVESQDVLLGGTMFRGEETGVRTAPDGGFRLEGLRGEDGYVAVYSPNALREGKSGRVRLRTGYDATELELAVIEVPHTRRLHGTVLHADGSPAASVSIWASRESWRGSWQRLGVTDASGVFELVSPWAGVECEITLRKSDGSHQPLGTLQVGTRGHTLHLP